MTKVMDLKNKRIKSFQNSKEEGMKMFASGRDATLLVTAYVENYKSLSEDELKQKLLDWKLWFFVTFYDTDVDNQLKENAEVPF